MSKKILRSRLINLRKKKFIEKRIPFIQFKKILNSLNFNKKINIGGYYPINSEIDCLDILKNLEKNYYGISLPITNNNYKMDFYEWTFKDLLKVGRQGIPEPEDRKKVFPDVLIVPLVAFDNNKFRLGYGGGFYDRYINKNRNLKKFFTVGLAFSFQEIKKIPINKFDQKLDIILTDKKIIK